MRIRIGANISNLGQVVSQPDFIAFAMGNSYQIGLVDEVRTVWNKMAVSNTGDSLVRMGRVVTNDTHFKFLPDDRAYTAVLPFYGGSVGIVGFVPTEEFLGRYRIVKDEATPKLLAMTPLPSDFKNSMGLDVLVTATSNGYELAQKALVAASSGNVAQAQVLLDGRDGASESYEKSNVAMRVLIGFGMMSQEEAFDYGKESLVPLVDVIGKARGAIIRQQDTINAIYDQIASLTVGSAAVGASTPVKNRLEELVQMYKAVEKYIAKQSVTIASIEALSSSAEEKNKVEQLKASLAKVMVTQQKIASDLRNIGVNPQELNGLGFIQIVPILLYVFRFAAIGVLLKKALLGITHGFIAGIGFGLYGQVEKSLQVHELSFDEQVKIYKQMERAQQKAAQENRAEDASTNVKSENDRMIELILKNKEGAKNAVDLGKDLEKISQDPMLKAKADSAQQSLDSMDKQSGSANKTNYTHILAAAAALFGAYLIFFRSKE